MLAKRFFTFVMASILSVSVFSGCGNTGSTHESSQITDTSNSSVTSIDNMVYKESEWKKFSPEINATFGYPHDINDSGFSAMAKAGEPYNDNRWIKFYKDKVGINCSYKLLAPNADDYTQKIVLAMTSGDLPDIFWIKDLSLYKQLYEAGSIADLTDIYTNQANPVLRSVLEGEGEGFLNNFTFDGKLYGIPAKMPSTNNYNYLWVRKDWLKKLNLEEPKTMDDVRNVAKAFKEKDPDGNGKEDTIGLTIDNTYLEMSGMGIFWAFGGQPAGNKYWSKLEDGTVGYSLVQKELKGGLSWLQNMYKENLLNKEFSTKWITDYTPMIADNKIGMFYGCHWYSNYLNGIKDQIAKEAEWVPLLAPGIDGKPAKVYANIDFDGVFCVNAKYKNPEAIVAMFNAYTENLFGKKNEFGKYFACEGNSNCWKSGPIYMLSKDVDLNPHREMKQAKKDGTLEQLTGVGGDYWKYIKQGNKAYDLMFGPENSCFDLVDKTYPDIMVWNSYQGAPTDTWVERWNSMQEIITSSYINIIVGKLDADEGFDKMVKDWYSAGGEQVTKEVNEIITSR